MLIIPFCSIAVVATVANTDYSWHGIGLMTMFFLFRNKPFLIFLFGLPFLMEFRASAKTARTFRARRDAMEYEDPDMNEFISECGIRVCLAYNGERGFV